MVENSSNAFGRHGLENSVVLVTGATGHLGQAIALGLGLDGAIPAINGRHPDKVDALADRLAQAGIESLRAPGDVTDGKAMAALLQTIAARAHGLGRCFDGLVCNAFAGQSGDQALEIADLYAQAARTNIGAVAQMIDQFAKLAGDYPRSVVTIASIYGIVSPDPTLYPDGVPVNPSHYGATKAGLLQLTRTLAVALAPQKIRVNAVVPGPFPKDEVQLAEPEFVQRLAGRVPMQRLGEAHEVYPPIRFLLRPDASYVTGTSIAVDGGWTAI